jgi:hypothetical protein
MVEHGAWTPEAARRSPRARPRVLSSPRPSPYLGADSHLAFVLVDEAVPSEDSFVLCIPICTASLS